ASLKRIRLDVVVPPDLPRIEGDELQLDRVFANLVSNALKFTPEGGRVMIRAGRRDAGVQVEVEDSGPGIPAPERERVFQLYHQTDRGRQAGGAGLGLFVVRTVLEAHNASIEIDDGEPQGCVFRIVLPAPAGD
ncbi:MAG: sensor histidine kinase, partial [Candidatus Binatia bacterium]